MNAGVFGDPGLLPVGQKFIAAFSSPSLPHPRAAWLAILRLASSSVVPECPSKRVTLYLWHVQGC